MASPVFWEKAPLPGLRGGEKETRALGFMFLGISSLFQKNLLLGEALIVIKMSVNEET